MRLRIAEPEIDKDNPFINDKLERKTGAEVLTQLFSNIEGPFVISLNAPWGTGKTIFIKMLRQHLHNCGFPSVYFNAWEKDFHDNPLIAFIGEIYSGIDELKFQGFETERAKKIFKKIKKTGKDILKKSIPVAVKSSAHRSPVIDKGMDDSFSDFISGVLEEQIINYSATKNLVHEFKKHFKEMIELLQKKEHDERAKPFLIFIDELDRCRPDYTVQILEKAKLFFDIEGVIIVLASDVDQLGFSVKNVYGQNMKERGYLRKFIDLEYNLPADNYTSELYCNWLTTETAITGLLNKNSDAGRYIEELKYSGILMAITFSMSLRELNILFNTLYLVFLTYEQLEIETVALTVILVSLKMKHTGLYNKAVNKERSVLYLINELNKVKKDNSAVKKYDEYFIERSFIPLSLKTISDSEYHQQVHQASAHNNNELVEIYKIIKEKNKSEATRIYSDILVNKIRMLDSFKFSG